MLTVPANLTFFDSGHNKTNLRMHCRGRPSEIHKFILAIYGFPMAQNGGAGRTIGIDSLFCKFRICKRILLSVISFCQSEKKCWKKLKGESSE
jgi:hypothetical protein